MKEKHAENRIISTGSYTAVWLTLLVLLAVTIAVARLHLFGRFSVLGALAIASFKAWLVLAFFMRIIYEEKVLKGMLALTIATLTLLIGITFVDVWYR